MRIQIHSPWLLNMLAAAATMLSAFTAESQATAISGAIVYDRAAARNLYEQGQIAWQQKDHARAAGLFEMALQFAPDGVSLYYYLGALAAQQDQCPRAMRYFHLFLLLADDDPLVEKTRNGLAFCDGVSEQPVAEWGILAIANLGSDLNPVIDGQVISKKGVGNAAQILVLAAGPHELSWQSPRGRVQQTVVVEIATGRRLDFDAEGIAAEATPAEPRKPRRVAWYFLAGGAAFLGAGFTADYHQSQTNRAIGRTPEDTPRFQTLEDRFKDQQAMGIVFYGAGIASLLVGGYCLVAGGLLETGSFQGGTSNQILLPVPSLGPALQGLTVLGRF